MTDKVVEVIERALKIHLTLPIQLATFLKGANHRHRA